MDYRLSAYGHASVAPSPVNRMMAAFATDFRDHVDINLGVGYVNEKTIPGLRLVEAMREVAEHPERYRQPFNYGGPKGSPNLERALRTFYIERGIGRLNETLLDCHELVVGPSGATSILEALADLFEPGIVVTADPMYYIYCNHLERKGFQLLTVPEDRDGLDATAVETQLEALGDRARELAFFYVVTVNNPSGVILSNTHRRGLVRLAGRWSQRLGRAVPVFFDQAYEWLIHDPNVPPPESAMIENADGLAYEIGTLSKIIAPALRIGFMLGRPGPLMRAIVQKTSDVGFSAPLMNQEIAAYMLENHMDAQLNEVNAGYRTKARQVRQAIDETLGPWLEDCRGGQGGFYYYLTLKELATDTASPFFHFLARTTGDPQIDGPDSAPLPRVIYLPGEFCTHPRGASAELGRRQLRLSYGYEDTDVIEQALHHMRDAAWYAEENPAGIL